MKLDSPGEYIVTIKGKHSAKLTKNLQTNEFIPKCSKVSFYYQVLKISDVRNTYDEEFAANTGGMDASNDNCKNVEIDTIETISQYLESERTRNSIDVSAKLLIPDPTSKKKIGFLLRSANKPIMSVVKVSASLPENVRQSTNLKFHLKVTEVNGKTDEDLLLKKSLEMYDQEIAFLLDDTENKNYYISIEFEEVDFDLIQTFCSYIEIRVAREPAMDLLVSLSSFEKTKKYQDISTLKTKPRTVTIDKEKATKIQFFQTKSSIQSLKSKVIGRITIDVQVDQAQLDILAEYNYLGSSVKIEVLGDHEFKDYGAHGDHRYALQFQFSLYSKEFYQDHRHWRCL